MWLASGWLHRLRVGLRLGAAGLVMLMAALIPAVASAETVIIRNDFSWVGEIITNPCTGEELTVTAGYEHQMERAHYDRDGNLVWTSAHQTDTIWRAVAADGTEYQVREIDNIRYTEDGMKWIGVWFGVSRGQGDDWRFIEVFKEQYDGSYAFDHLLSTCS